MISLVYGECRTAKKKPVDSKKLSLLRSNTMGNQTELITKPRVRRLSSNSRMPCHEISKRFHFAWRPNHPDGGGRSCQLAQTQRHGENKIGASDCKNGWHEIGTPKHGIPS